MSIDCSIAANTELLPSSTLFHLGKRHHLDKRRLCRAGSLITGLCTHAPGARDHGFGDVLLDVGGHDNLKPRGEALPGLRRLGQSMLGRSCELIMALDPSNHSV